MSLKSISQNKVYRKLLMDLSDEDKEKVSSILETYINEQIRNKTNWLEGQKRTLENEAREDSKYRGFYEAVINCKSWSRSSDDWNEHYLKGVEEALTYLTNRPDQIIQHLQDPNPQEKVYQHRKDSYRE